MDQIPRPEEARGRILLMSIASVTQLPQFSLEIQSKQSDGSTRATIITCGKSAVMITCIFIIMILFQWIPQYQNLK